MRIFKVFLIISIWTACSLGSDKDYAGKATLKICDRNGELVLVLTDKQQQALINCMRHGKEVKIEDYEGSVAIKISDGKREVTLVLTEEQLATIMERVFGAQKSENNEEKESEGERIAKVYAEMLKSPFEFSKFQKYMLNTLLDGSLVFLAMGLSFMTYTIGSDFVSSMLGKN